MRDQMVTTKSAFTSKSNRLEFLHIITAPTRPPTHPEMAALREQRTSNTEGRFETFLDRRPPASSEGRSKKIAAHSLHSANQTPACRCYDSLRLRSGFV